MIDNLELHFKNYVFDGLKFSSEIRFSEEYCNKLLMEGSHYSKVKLTDRAELELKTSMHCKLSWYFVLRVLAIVCLAPFLLLLAHKLMIPASIMLLWATLCHLLSRMFFKKVGESWECLQTMPALFDILFQARREELEEQARKKVAG